MTPNKNLRKSQRYGQARKRPSHTMEFYPEMKKRKEKAKIIKDRESLNQKLLKQKESSPFGIDKVMISD